MNDGEHKPGKYGGVLYQTGKKGIWQISYQNDKGQEVRESTRTTDEALAAKILEARRRAVIKAEETGEDFEAPKLRKQTIAQCLDNWKVQCDIGGKWTDCYRSDLKQLLERFGNLTVAQLSKARIQEYQLEQKRGLDEKRSRGRNAKLNRHLVILSSAIKISGATPSYAKQMKDLKLPEPPARQGYFTPAEFRILVSALPPHIVDVIECCWLTGWRVSEVCGKKILGKFRAGVLWSEMEGNSLLLPGERNKGREAKRIPLTGSLLELIEKRRRLKVAGCDMIFCRPDGKPIGDFYRHWKKACIAAGKPNGMVHDLRRSRARIWGKAGVSETVAMKLGGWKTPEVWRRYQVIDESDLIHAQEKTERYLLEEAEKRVGTKQISTVIN